MITGFPSIGGSGMVATRLGLELANRSDYEVHMLFYKKPFLLENQEILPANLIFHQIERSGYALFKDIGAPFTIHSASSMARIVKSEQIDIIHSHYAIPHAVSAYLANQMNPVKTVVTTHGSDTHTLGKHVSYQSTISLALRNSDIVTSVSDFLARESEVVFGLDEGSVRVIYDFINTEIFNPIDFNDKELSIVQASNFRSVKRIPMLIEIFSKINEDFPDWELKLVGDGPELTTSVRITREMNLQNQVKFLGIRADIPDIFSRSSILISASEIESFGLTIAEAMSCGTPVIAPRVGGIPEVVNDGITGLLYDSSDMEDAVDKLSRMMADHELRKRMGINSREQIKNKFSVQKIVSQYDKLYSELL